jgi:hypothetical protein
MNEQLASTSGGWSHSGKTCLRKRRRLALAPERQARRRKSSTASGPSRLDRSARATALPLNRGASLVVVLLLSLGLWAAICGAVDSLASAALG